MKKLRLVAAERHHTMWFHCFDLTSSFFGLFFKIHLIHAHAYTNYDTWQSCTFVTERKILPNI
jgi:hypothetical protein